MKIAIMVFSVDGIRTAKKLAKHYNADMYVAKRHAGTQYTAFDSIYEITKHLFNSVDAFIFISAIGIAVRAIASNINSKLTDPAVVVVDDSCRFCVSVLSGHAGGANDLCIAVSDILGAQPVITTASDSYFMKQENTDHSSKNEAYTSRELVLGIGCRKGLSAEHIERTATILLWDFMIPLKDIVCAASIDVKQNEEGLLGFVNAHNIPISFYSAQQLNSVQGEFTSSDFVKRTVGVDNVCERAAMLCGNKGSLIVKKTALNGVTIAVFERK